MTRDEKQAAISNLSQRLQAAKGVILAEYRGLKVSQMTQLRREMRKNDCEIRVVKNRLARKAMEGTPWSGLEAHLKGPLAIAIADQDPVILAKVLAKFAETAEVFKITAGSIGDKVFTSKDVHALSKLPSKEELYAKLLGTLMAPAQGLVRTLQGVPQKLAIALKAILDTKK